ncbi:hypothetical protein [Thalassobaculum sp.]|uniref:hypothetical protein n=1 Tax=Thalassobaculum sp. TaxID=2022740 RepID=UPI0032F03603
MQSDSDQGVAGFEQRRANQQSSAQRGFATRQSLEGELRVAEMSPRFSGYRRSAERHCQQRLRIGGRTLLEKHESQQMIGAWMKGGDRQNLAISGRCRIEVPGAVGKERTRHDFGDRRHSGSTGRVSDSEASLTERGSMRHLLHAAQGQHQAG